MSETRQMCMLCLNCKTYRHRPQYKRHVYVRVRCIKGHWKSPGGSPSTSHLFAVRTRVVEGCPDYNPVCNPDDADEHIRHLNLTLPLEPQVSGGAT